MLMYLAAAAAIRSAQALPAPNETNHTGSVGLPAAFLSSSMSSGSPASFSTMTP